MTLCHFVSHLIPHDVSVLAAHATGWLLISIAAISGWFGEPSNVLNNSDHINDIVDIADGLFDHCSKSFENWYFYSKIKNSTQNLINIIQMCDDAHMTTEQEFCFQSKLQ